MNKLQILRMACRVLLTVGFVAVFTHGNLCSAADVCPNYLVGGTEFAPSIGHDEDLYYEVSNVVHLGPRGNAISTPVSMPDSAHHFVQDSFCYAVVKKPINIDSLLPDIEHPMFMFKPNTSAISRLLSYTVVGLKPGTVVSFEFTIEDFTSSDDCKTANQWSQNIIMYGKNLNAYAAGAKSVQVKFGESITIKDTFHLSNNETFFNFDFVTGHNFVKCSSLGISNLKFYGCINPKVKSSQGLEVCDGEQTLFSLDREYNAKSYTWEKSLDGVTWTAFSSKKNAMLEIDQDYFIRCDVDGFVSEPIQVKKVVCCVVNGMPASRKTVFFEDFGYFPNKRIYVDKDGNESQIPAANCDYRVNTSFNLPAHVFDPDGAVNDGHYAVLVPTPNGYIKGDNQPATWMSGVIADHSSALDGRPNGAALFINVNNQHQSATGTAGYKGPVFESVIDGLCKNKELYFECYVANLSGGEDPYVSMYILDADDPSLPPYGSIENIVVGKGAGWIQMRMQGITLPDKSRALLQVVADCGTRCNEGSYWNGGNDLIIDDIKFMTCSPPSISLYSDINTLAQDTIICSDQKFTLEAPTSKLLENYFSGNHMFLFQVSVDGGNTWSVVKYHRKSTAEINTADYPGVEEMQFRIIVGSQSALDIFNADPNAVVVGDDCSDFSISEPFTITRAGDLDMGAPSTVKACGGDTVALKGSSDPTIVAWQWRNVGGDLTALGSDISLKDYSVEVEKTDSFYFVGYDKNGCKGIKQIVVEMNPTVTVALDEVQDCGLTTVTATVDPATASIVWVNGVDTVKNSTSVLELDETTPTADLKVSATALNYCPSKVVDLSTSVKSVPKKVSASDVSLFRESGSEDITDLVAVPETGNFLQFYAEGSTSATKNLLQDKSTAGEFVYSVTQVNADGCESDTAQFTVTVNDAPKPRVKDTAICAGGSVADLSVLVTKETPLYVLSWYDDIAKTNKLTTAPDLTNAKPGEYPFFVTQTNPDTGAESDAAQIVVTVYGVMPVVANDIVYCADDVAEELKAVAVVDNANFFYGDGFNWYQSGVLQPVVPTPDTKVLSSTVYDYEVSQTYTLPSGEVCESDKVAFAVSVNKEVAPTGTFNVNYLKSEGDADGKFIDLLSKNSNVAVAETGSELVWYDENEVLIGNGSLAPAPPYNAALPAGTEETYTYYVSQKDANGCESEKKKVVVSISSSPKPDVIELGYCEGEVPASLTTAVAINVPAGMTAADYELVWYDGDPENGGVEISQPLEINTDLADPASLEEVKKYYVAQRSVNPPVSTSKPSVINVTIYAKPVLISENPDPVCMGFIDLNKQWRVSKAVKTLTVGFYDEDKTSVMARPSAVGESGTYYIRGYFSVVGSGSECSSDLVSVNVKIDTLSGLKIDGPAEACPFSNVDLTASVAEVNVNATVNYTWDLTGGAIANKESFTSGALSASGTVHTFSVEASSGSCKETASFNVTVGDGVVSGFAVFTEKDNADLQGLKLTAGPRAMVAYSCGGVVNVNLDGVVHDPNSTFKLIDATGNVVDENASSFDITPARGNNNFTVEYVNECKTSFSMNIVSIPIDASYLASDTEICEGESFALDLTVDCDEVPKVSWFKDAAPFVNNGNSIKFAAAKPDNGGLYSYEISNRGCLVKGEMAMPLKVKPYVKASVKDSYVTVREDNVSIPVDVTLPASGAVFSWKSAGTEVATANPYEFVAEKDLSLSVEVTAPDHCPVSLQTSVVVDAKLSLLAEMADTICYGEVTKLTVDTTGTGNLLEPSKLKLSLRENTPTSQRVVPLLASMDGAIYANLSPGTSTKYKLVYAYRQGEEGEQIIEKEFSLEVMPDLKVTIPKGLVVCSGDELTIELQDVSPANAIFDWNVTDALLSTSGSTAVVMPLFTAPTGTSQNYTFRFVGYYGSCKPKNYQITVVVDKPFEGVVEATDVICEGATATLSAASYGAKKYSWTSDAFEGERFSHTISLKPDKTAIYHLLAERGACKVEESVEVKVNSKPVILGVDSIDYRDVMIVADPSYGTAPLSYKVSGRDYDMSPEKTGLTYAKHTAYVLDAAGCEAEFEFEIPAPAILPNIQFSPNGDGINDVWEVPGLVETYPDAKISIFDRFGKLLVQYTGADGGWDGTYNGSDMPATDYWYEIDIDEIDMVYIGHFTLLRR